jgi:probable HAF family extracellular repeat protein
VLTTKQVILTGVAALVISSACSDSPTDTGPAIATLTIENAPADSLAVTETAALSYTALDEAGEPVEGAKVKWTSSDTEIAEINSAGVLTAAGIGASATITASGGGATATTVVNVKPKLIRLFGQGPYFLVGINDAGEGAALGPWAYRMNADHTFTELPAPPYNEGGEHSSSSASGIDNVGRIVGVYYLSNGEQHAVMWTGTTMQELGALEPNDTPYSVASGSNLNGTVVGYSRIKTTQTLLRGFVWTASAGMQELPNFGGDTTYAAGINAGGAIVGGSNYFSGGPPHAFIRRAGEDELTDLSTLGGDRSSATAINDNSQVVGYSQNPQGESRAFLWTSDEGMTDLGTIASRTNSIATRINAAGEVVGYSYGGPSPNGSLAFLWTKKRGMINLGAPPPPYGFSYAFGINSSGLVVGYLGDISGWGPVIWITRKPTN